MRWSTVIVAGLLAAGCNQRPAPGSFSLRREAMQPPPEPVVKVVEGRDPRLGASVEDAARLLDGPPVDLIAIEQIPLAQACPLLSRLLGVNLAASPAAGERSISLHLRTVTPRAAIQALCSLNQLTYRLDPGIVRIYVRDEGGEDLVPSSDEETRLYRLRHASANGIADLIATLMPDRVSYTAPTEQASFGHVGTDGDSAMGGSSTGTSSVIGGSGTSGGTGGAGTAANGAGSGRSTGTSAGGVNRQSFGYGPAGGQSPTGGSQSQSRTSGAVPAASRGGMASVPNDVPATLSVFMRDNCVAVRSRLEPVHREIAGIIAALDSPTRQVLLEVKILHLVLGDGFESLFKFSFRDGKNTLATLASFTQASSAVSFAYLDQHIWSSMQLLASENRLHTVASPLLLCANNGPAEFFSGIERMITVNYDYETRYNSSGDSTSTVDIVRAIVESREIGTRLRIKPSINADATVTMRFLLESGTVNDGAASMTQVVDGETIKLPIDTISEERLESIVVARHGQAVVMGGLISETVSRTKQGIPWLSDIPLLGLLASQRKDSAERVETVVMIIPHIMATAEEGARVSGEVNRRLSTHPWVRHDETALTDWDEKSEKLQLVVPATPATAATAAPAR